MQVIRRRFGFGRYLLMGVLACCSGCDWLVYGGFLDPTSLGAYHGPDKTLEIRKSISLSEEPDGIPGATDPTPADAVTVVEDYKIGPKDQVIIRILDLIIQDQETSIQTIVDNLGNVYIPEARLWYRMEGQTVREAQLGIAQAIRDRQIIRDPEVIVQILTPRQQTYTVYGAVQSPGLFEIVRSDFRLLEALNSAGANLEPLEDYIYVFRAMPSPQRRIDQGAALETRPGGGLHDTAGDPGADREKVPFTPVALSTGLDGSGPPATAGGTAHQASGRNQSASASAPAINRGTDEKELLDAITPQIGSSVQRAATGPTEEPGLSKWIWLNGEWVEVRQGPATTLAPPTPTSPTAPGEPVSTRQAEVPQSQPEIDWEELAGEPDQRIIRIPVKSLRDGDFRYNIAIRNGDAIRVPAGPIGEFYVGGNVSRPGTYSLTGRQITLKQAIVSAGMLSILAWPERCEVIRRIDQDREVIVQEDLRKIFSGEKPDLRLKPNDIVMVGTHAVAPFLATLRNSFRLSYGFGFVYDRNFADIDSFQARYNPDTAKLFGSQTTLQNTILQSLLR